MIDTMAMIGMVLFLGLAVLVACAMMPREIGKEDLPLSRVRLRMPDVEGLALRMNKPRRPAPRPAYQRPTIVPPPPAPAADQLSAMGAPQPDPGGLMALPGQ